MPDMVRRYYTDSNFFISGHVKIISIYVMIHVFFYHLVKSTDKDTAIEINLNINLNGISNVTLDSIESNGIKILDEQDEIPMSSLLATSNVNT